MSKGIYIRTEKMRENMSKSHIGKAPWNKGKIGIYTKETIKKMSLSKKGKHLSPNTEFKKGLHYSVDTEFKKGHILYVSTEWLSKYSEVAGKVGDLPTLIITEHATGTNKGDINFIHKDGKLAFEINSPNLTKHRLKASAELVRFAVTN